MNRRQDQQRMIDVFDRAAPSYDRVGVDYFGVFGARLVELAGLHPGQRVLDLGCGRGAVLLPAARAVGRSGSVLGIDAAPGMVVHTVAELSGLELPQARVRLGDAEDPPGQQGDYDAVLAGLVLFFLADIERALARYARLLGPGGLLAFSWFGPDDARWKPVFGAMNGLAPPGSTPLGRSTAKVWEDIGSVEAALTTAGFAAVRTIEESFDITIRDAEQWWSWSWSHGGRGFLEQFPADRHAALRSAAETAMDGVRRPDGTISIRPVLRFTTARMPAREQTGHGSATDRGDPGWKPSAERQ